MTRYAGVFCAVAVAIVCVGARSYTVERQRLDAEVRGQLEQIADLKSTQIAAWRMERLGDAAAVEADARLMPAVEQALRGSADETTRHHVLAWMNAIRTSYQYATVALVDTRGRVTLLSGERLLTSSRYAELARDTASDDDLAFHDVAGAGALRPHLVLGVTIWPERGSALGSILLSIDPAVALYTSILQWPLAAPTSRVELIEDGRIDAPPGVLMSAPKRIPNSSWRVVSRVDADQAFLALGQTRRQILIVSSMLIVLCVISLGLAWRHQLSTFYRQQYEAEAERQLLRGHYDYLTRFANDALVLMNQDGRLLEVNDRTVEMYGATRDELLAMNVRELRSPSALPEFDEQWEVIQGRGSLVFETEHQRKDGLAFPVEISTRVVRVGSKIFRQSTIRDISERKRADAELAAQDERRRQAEEELRVSNDRLERVLDAMDEGYWDRNVATGELHVSPRWYTMRGYLPGEISVDGDSWLAMVHADDRPRLEALTVRVHEAGEAEGFGVEYRVRCKSGQYIWVCSRGKTIERDADGRAIRRVGTVSDITERKKLEARFLQAQKLESIGRLAGGVAHDFNNLLTVINGFSDLVIAEMEIGGRHQQHLQAIREAGERGAALTQQLLAFSRKQIIQPRVVGVNQVLAEVDGLLRRMAGDEVKVLTHLSACPDRILADPSQLHQVVMNLVVNARDAMPHGGTITIRTRAEEIDAHQAQDVVPGWYVLLSVQDTGVGMDEATREFMFEPFYTTKEQGKGTGLGLSTVYGIVQQSGGFIRVDSQPGKGTLFSLYFPVAAAGIAREPVHVPNMSMGAQTSPRPTLLVVDDDPAVRSLFPGPLADTCHVLLASDGAEAVEIVRRTPRLDAILTDLFMPNMEGFEMIGVARELRPDLRIIAMSGAFGGRFLEGAERAGAHATLTKPFDIAALRQTIDRVLASGIA